ncbi:MAG: AbrB family transcriptional regulator [Actinobacteria bacterium]|nr:MAG: AbrB family transcriptional regulator [Actinomycetota bacterium]
MSAIKPCCCVDAIVSVDERGQLVLPKDIRSKCEIKPGEKMALISWKEKGNCCITLVKADNLTSMVKELLGPMAKHMMKK